MKTHIFTRCETSTFINRSRTLKVNDAEGSLFEATNQLAKAFEIVQDLNCIELYTLNRVVGLGGLEPPTLNL